MSRGSIFALSAGTRRSLALLWTALLLSTLFLQYASFVAPAKVLAVHNDGLFELDGNTANDPVVGDDWDSHPGATGSRSLFITDPLSAATDDIYTGGSTKDGIDIPSWKWTTGSVPDKDNIEHAFAASYTVAAGAPNAGHNIIYFGLDRYATNGDSFVGFWFTKVDLGKVAGGTFSGKHSVGDLLVLSNFTNGGAVATIQLFEWVGSGGSDGTLDLLATGNECTGAPVTDKACADSNTGPIQPGWTFDDKGASGTDNPIPAGGFFEGGIDLTDLFGGSAPCFSGFIGETRASQSVSAVLKDFALGSFNTCEPPAITTHVQQGGQNLGSLGVINKGESVTDHAALSGANGAVTGSVKFYVCRDASAAPDCSTGGDQVGTKVDIASGAADSASYTPTQLGYYCFRVEYTPDAAGSNHYVAASHTNKTTECFQVIPAEIKLTKTADAASVSAGSQIGFTLTILSKGPGSAFGVKVSDTLPTDAGLSWTIDAANSDSGWALTSGVLTFGGANGVTLAKDATSHVHIVSSTTSATCGVVNNKGDATTTNDGTSSDSASVTVLCPDVTVTKTPNNGSVNRGETATFSIKVENLGPGAATGVVVKDNLPAGLHWTTGEADCFIAGADGSQVLTCNVGSLASGADKTYTVSANTSLAACAVINNTATVTATNEPAVNNGNNSDDGAIEVLCAQIHIAKTSDNATVSAGDEIGFTITVSNTGAGVATNVNASDTLDSKFTWSLDPAVAGWTLVGNQLSYHADSLAGGASSAVHVVATSDAENCRVVNNKADVTTGNDGSDSASASTTILCPDLHVDKTAANGTINAGDTASFTMTVTNDGKGTAYGVTLNDPLPAGVAWKTDTAGCSIANGTLSCDFGTLAAGASTSVTVTGPTTPAVCGLLDNKASVAGTNESAADAMDNSDSAAITVNCPDVHVAKTAANATISAGDIASFTMTVTNDGKGTAYGVTLNDPLPAGIAWTDDSVTCDIANGILACKFGDLLAGASASVTVSGVTDAADCSILNNTATTAAGNESAADAEDNSDSASITVQCPDLHVDKTADQGTINAGDTASFTMTVTNDGKGTAYDVSLTDTLPTGITWTTDSKGCSIAAGVLTCNFDTLQPGAKASATVKGETTAAACGILDNTATTAASNESAEDAKDNSDSASITVNCPAIMIIKTADAPVVNAGDGIGFVVTVSNTGAGTAYGVTVNDPLPANNGLGWTIDGANSDAGFSIVDGKLVYGPADLGASKELKVHIVSGTSAVSCGLVDNTATLTYRGGSDSDSASVTVNCPDVHVNKTADQGTINAGDAASFTMKVTNDGKGTAYGVTLKDTLPAGIAWTTDSKGCSIAAGVLSCTFGDLEPGASASATVSGPTTAAACGVLDNTANVGATNESAADAEDNSDSASITVNCPDVSLTKTADNSPILAGQAAGYIITVTNVGKGTASDVVVTDTLPAGLTWTSDQNAVCSIVAGVLTCNVGDMEPGATFTVKLSAPTTVAACGDLPNTASAEASNEPDTALDNNEDSATVVVKCASISLVKTAGIAADGTQLLLATPGNVIFTYVVTNTGTAALQAVALVDDNATPANTADDITVTCPKLTLDPGESMTCTATLPVTYGLRTNIATVTAETVLEPTSQVSDTDDAVVRVPQPEVTPTPTPKPTPKLTPPPTSTLATSEGTGSSGTGLLLVLASLAGLMLAVGYLAPTRSRARRRSRRG